MTLWQLAELQPPAILGYVRDLLPDPDYVMDQFMPNRTVDDIDVKYLLGARQRPVMATIMGWDSTTPFGQRRRQAAEVAMSLPPIKRQERVSETEIIRYMQPRRGSADEQAALDSVYDQIGRLVDSEYATFEWLKAQAVTARTLLWNSDGVIFEFNYGIPNDNRISLVTQAKEDGGAVTGYGPVWINADGTYNSANSTPIADLMKFQKDHKTRTGAVIARYLDPGGRFYDAVIQAESTRRMIFGTNDPVRPVLPQELALLMSQLRIAPFVENDVSVGLEAANGTVTQVRTQDSRRLAAVPAQTVGEFLIGPTAEARLSLPQRYAQQAPGLWAQVVAQDEPPAVFTKVAAVGFPSLPQAGEIGHLIPTAHQLAAA